MEKKTDLAIRLALFAMGLVVMAFGIAIVIKVDIGVAPGSAIPYSISKLVPLTVGMCSSVFHVFCVLMQLIIARRPSLKLFLQFPIAYVFGFLLDFFLGFMVFELPGLPQRVLLLLAGLPVFSFGIRAVVGADVLIVPTDGLARAMGEKFGWAMSKAKLIFDIIVTAAGVALMLIFTGNAFLTVNIGTIICAAGTGPFIGLFTKLFPALDKKNSSP